jgi:ribosomal protein S18 acetylase RimI-like enzyme
VCRPATREELTAALGVVLGTVSEPADDGHVLDFLRFAQRRGINAGGAWLAGAGGVMAWAVLPIVSPGRTMLLLTPGSGPPHPAALAAGELVDAVCRHFGARDVQLAQVLLDPSDAASHRLYEGRGFERVAQLIYLQAVPRRKAAPPALPPGMRWVGYTPASHEQFARAIAETYGQSLDCPRLNGLRDIEDVIAGHKASGEFDPRLWALLCEGERALGALLLSRASPPESLELVYLGLTPSARGQGLGDVMMRQALAAAAADGAARLSLAVDSENAPALKLYYRHGMQRIGAKLALMRRLDEASGIGAGTRED